MISRHIILYITLYMPQDRVCGENEKAKEKRMCVFVHFSMRIDILLSMREEKKLNTYKF